MQDIILFTLEKSQVSSPSGFHHLYCKQYSPIQGKPNEIMMFNLFEKLQLLHTNETSVIKAFLFTTLLVNECLREKNW
jgi:hypothetical protein